jgi:hypothetical protein
MKPRAWFATALMLVGIIGGIALWRIELVLPVQLTEVSLSGPDTFVHDTHLALPAWIPMACLFMFGLILLLATWRRSTS